MMNISEKAFCYKMNIPIPILCSFFPLPLCTFGNLNKKVFIILSMIRKYRLNYTNFFNIQMLIKKNTKKNDVIQFIIGRGDKLILFPSTIHPYVVEGLDNIDDFTISEINAIKN